MNEQRATNVVWHDHKVERKEREQLLKQKGVILWFTGLSGSGKSTVANEVAYKLQEMGKLAYILQEIYLLQLTFCRNFYLLHKAK